MKGRSHSEDLRIDGKITVKKCTLRDCGVRIRAHAGSTLGLLLAL